MKISTFSNYFPEHTGGIELVALNMVKGWRELYQVRWIACDIKSRAHVCETDDIPLPAFNYSEEHLGFPYPIPSPKSTGEIFKQVIWCDVVHIHDCLYIANLIAFVASQLYRKPLLVTQHAALASYPQAYKRILQWIAYKTIGKIILQNAEQVVFISMRVKNWFESWISFKHETAFIPNGVDHHLFYPPTLEERTSTRIQLKFTADIFILLFVGQFMQNKGIHLVHAIAQARPNYHWLMLGSGEIDPRGWKLQNIHLVPPRPQSELRTYYIAADLFVLPSVGEGFPLSVQESLSCGLPVAVSQETAAYVPDAPLIKLDVTSVSAMLQTLDDLASNGENLISLRNKSAKFSQYWSWKNVNQSYRELFMRLIY